MSVSKDAQISFGEKIKWLIMPIFFLVLAVWLFVTGCDNILQINYLNKNGVEVQVTVTGKRIDSSRENTENYYTFSYEYDEKSYHFEDSPDREYSVGDVFVTMIDPENPQILQLPSSNLAFAFLMLLFSGASLFVYEGFRFLSKYVPHALIAWSGLMVLTGILLPSTTAWSLGLIFLISACVVWRFVSRRKHSNA